MNIPKDLIQKLSVLKSNSALLVPIVIGLVGILLFIPTQLMSGKLKKRIEDESISKRGRQVKSLNVSAVSSEQWKKEQERQQDYARDANEIELLAKQGTERELLSYKIFPEPTDTSTLIFKEFGQRYRDAVDKLIVRINACDCPTEVELKRALEMSSERSGPGSTYPSRELPISPMYSTRPSMTPYGSSSVVEDTIVDEICRERAKSACVYANPADLSGYEFWIEYKYIGVNQAIEDCWYYQLAYWVIEDVIDTMGVMNAGSSSVLTSPVKQLMNVNFNPGKSGYQTSAMSRPLSRARQGTAGDKPIYVLSLQEALIEPCTARYCNNDIDVIHFNVVVLVSAKAVLPFMQQLCSAKEHKFRGFSGDEPEQIFKHNQITVLESKISSVNREDQAHRLYRYGEDSVVELDLVCEYVFTKASYEDIKPASVKQAQKAEDETP